jgi:uncharacterized protein
MTGMWFPFLIGALGSAHCLGMCGPIVVASSLTMGKAEPTQTNPLIPLRLEMVFLHFAFHAGRLLTYALMGGLAARFTQAAQGILTSSNAQSLLTSIYGALLILFGLAFMKAVPIPANWVTFFSNPMMTFMRRIPSLCESNRPVAKILLGIFTGLLPCCLSWSMVITAAAAESPFYGSVMMICFGAGTIPALFLAGISASYLTRLYRRLGETIPGLFLTALGIYLILKGNRIVE